MRRLQIHKIGLILFTLFSVFAFASDTIIVPKNGGTAYFKDTSGDLMPLSITYSTDGAGHLKLINSSNPVDDSITVPPNSGKMYLNGADGNLYPAQVIYTTDGNGNVIPVPSGGGGSVTSVTASSPLTSSGGTTPNISMLYTPVNKAGDTMTGTLTAPSLNVTSSYQYGGVNVLSIDGTGNGTNGWFGNPKPSSVTSAAGNFMAEIGDANTSWTSGSDNTCTGIDPCAHISTGQYNSAYGWRTGAHITTTNNSTFIGALAGTTTDGNANTAIGSQSMQGSSATASSETCVGASCLYNDLTSSQNACVGVECLVQITASNNNAALGYFAGYSQTGGSGNLYLGENADTNIVSPTDSAAIGYNAKIGASHEFTIGDGTINVGIGTTIPGATLHVVATTSTTTGAIIQGAASQASDLTDWENSTGTVLLYVDSSGTLQNYLPAPMTAQSGFVPAGGVTGTFIGNNSDNDQTNYTVVFGTTNTSNAANYTSDVWIKTGDLLGTSLSGTASGNIYILTGSAVVNDSTSASSPGNIQIGPGAAGSGAGATTTISGGSSNTGAGGDLDLYSGGNTGGNPAGNINLYGNASTSGTGGGILLQSGTGSVRGTVAFREGTEGQAGAFWVSKDTAGSGKWFNGNITQTLTAGGTILSSTLSNALQAASAVSTSTSTVITAGIYQGQVLKIVNVGSNTITLKAGGNTDLPGLTDYALASAGSISFIWMGTTWYTTSVSVN